METILHDQTLKPRPLPGQDDRLEMTNRVIPAVGGSTRYRKVPLSSLTDVMTVDPSTAPPIPERVPRRRVPREQAMRNMLAATVALLKEQDPDEVTVRDIAHRSGHNHRFVVEWFGSKVALFHLAFHELAAELTPNMRTITPLTARRAEMVRIIKLMNWLAAADPQLFDTTEDRPLLEAMIEGYRSRLSDPQVAQLMAQRAIATVMSMVLFRGPLQVDESTWAEQVALEWRILELLERHGLHD